MDCAAQVQKGHKKGLQCLAVASMGLNDKRYCVAHMRLVINNTLKKLEKDRHGFWRTVK